MLSFHNRNEHIFIKIIRSHILKSVQRFKKKIISNAEGRFEFLDFQLALPSFVN